MFKWIKILWNKVVWSRGLAVLLGLLLLTGVMVGAWLCYERINAARRQAAAGTDPAHMGENRWSESSAIRVYFSRLEGSTGPTETIAHALAGFIDRTRQTLDVCAFELDNQVITQALVQAVQRGVKVRLVTETRSLQQSGVQALRNAGVPLVAGPSLPTGNSSQRQLSSGRMHDKFMVFDQRAVWTGSLSFTETGAYRTNSNGLYIDDEDVASNYAAKFRWMFEQHSFAGLPGEPGSPGPASRVPHPNVTLRDGSRIETYFSTHDRVADRLIDKIGQAKLSIHFLAHCFTHPGISRAMLERAGRESRSRASSIAPRPSTVPPSAAISPGPGQESRFTWMFRAASTTRSLSSTAKPPSPARSISANRPTSSTMRTWSSSTT